MRGSPASHDLQRRSQTFLGLLAAAAGILIAVSVLLWPQGLRVPAWVVYATAGAFVFAGCQLMARDSGHRLLQAWLPVGVLACLMAPPAWIAFGAGPRRCGLALGGTFLRIFGTGSELPCRLGFALGALVLLAMLLLAVRQALRPGWRER
ncbi:MAG: hypothetical protein JWP22_2492 [Ramlibacter sp.]|nr:hypothetical protein [Ramlibacter sp.]